MYMMSGLGCKDACLKVEGGDKQTRCVLMIGRIGGKEERVREKGGIYAQGCPGSPALVE